MSAYKGPQEGLRFCFQPGFLTESNLVSFPVVPLQVNCSLLGVPLVS